MTESTVVDHASPRGTRGLSPTLPVREFELSSILVNSYYSRLCHNPYPILPLIWTVPVAETLMIAGGFCHPAYFITVALRNEMVTSMDPGCEGIDDGVGI